MNKTEKFYSFLESLKNDEADNILMIEAVKEGFTACVEVQEVSDEQMENDEQMEENKEKEIPGDYNLVEPNLIPVEGDIQQKGEVKEETSGEESTTPEGEEKGEVEEEKKPSTMTVTGDAAVAALDKAAAGDEYAKGGSGIFKIASGIAAPIHGALRPPKTSSEKASDVNKQNLKDLADFIKANPDMKGVAQNFKGSQAKEKQAA